MQARRVAWALTVAGVISCHPKDAATAAPVALASEQIADDTGKVQVDIGYRARAQREVELVVDLRAVGIEEMDKLAVDILVDGFVLVDGEPAWSGFVAPRLPIAHRASFRLLEGRDDGTLTVTVDRSMNSESLLERRLTFTAEGDRVAPVDEGD